MRTKRRVSEDRLSNLPEGVILRIISLLMKNAPKDACRTSVLSRYWRPLWCMIPDVYFSYNTIDSPEPEEAFDSLDRFVNRLLHSRKSKGFPIRKLKFYMVMHFNPISFDTHLISTWIRGAIDCHVENLELQVMIFDPDDVFVPLSVFDSDTITTLKLLSNLCFKPSPVSLPSLKTLEISNPHACCDEVVHCLLSSSPNLEEFDLNGRYDEMEIRPPKLKKLSARFNTINSDSRSLTIDAPSLEYLFLEDFFPTKYVIKNMENVMEAQLIIMVYRIDMRCLFSIFSALANVKSLSLSTVIKKQNHYDRFGYCLDGELQKGSQDGPFDHHLPQFDNLVHLKFDEICDLDLLPSFLRKSPNLETLVIERDATSNAIWVVPEEVPSCLSHLTHFAYRGFLPCKNALKIVEYFVRNSIMLKTVTVQPAMMRMIPYLKSKFIAELENITRGSKSCELIVEKDPFL